MKLIVKTCGNMDRGEPARLDHAPGFSEPVTDMADASRRLRSYLDANGLGGGNLKRADVVEGRATIASISFNGKVWPPGGWKPGATPIFDPYV